MFSGQPVIAHWGMPDPALVEGTEDERLALESRVEEIVRSNAPEPAAGAT